MAVKKSRNMWWALAAAWTLLIYSTLYIVRPVCEFLKQTIPFSLIMQALMAGLLAVFGFYVIKIAGIKRKSGYVLLFTLLAVYATGFVVIAHPEEKIHFIEYGILAFLLFTALRCDFGRLGSYAGAFMLSAAAGYGDELIQGALPNRYYQLEDVVLNTVSGALGLWGVYILDRERVVK